MNTDKLGQEVNEGDWVVINASRSLRVLRVCKVTAKMIVVEYFTKVVKARKTIYLYAADVIKLDKELVFLSKLNQ